MGKLLDQFAARGGIQASDDARRFRKVDVQHGFDELQERKVVSGPETTKATDRSLMPLGERRIVDVDLR